MRTAGLEQRSTADAGRIFSFVASGKGEGRAGQVEAEVALSGKVQDTIALPGTRG